MFYNIVYGILFFYRSVSLIYLYTYRQAADIVCADYFKVTVFWKKKFVKNGSFTNFWFVGSRN